MGEILIRRGDNAWQEPPRWAYDDESDLQQLLARHPPLIPGVTSEATTRTEFNTDVGPADIVVVEANGDLTIVECKLAKNPQVRREILGQLIDYAGRLWQMDIHEFEKRWMAGNRPALFGDSWFGNADFRDLVAANLVRGRFRLVLAVDEINLDLKRMVEYANVITTAETSLIAVEYIRFQYDDVEVLTPRTYGQDIADAKESRLKRSKNIWTSVDYRNWLKDNEPGSEAVFDELSERLHNLAIVFEGGPGIRRPRAHSVSRRRTELRDHLHCGQHSEGWSN
ncbi:hypothetical protein [Cryobacterium sp. Y29]|uniref:hypothetical protein n=1 Tax=Cryobacterium sp. Y29 TaxID=2048285 RepID=UPI000CE46AF8|nr:hypothetical protein [Cryobacterium sp. Y29]